MTETLSIFEKAFSKSDKTDAILVVQGKKLHVNKAHLSYHSDYFAGLINSTPGAEEFQIDDVEFEHFSVMLSQIHNDPMELIFYDKMFELANRFQLPAVKRHIELYLMTSNGDRDFKMKTADKHGLNDLMTYLLPQYDQKDFYTIDRRYGGKRPRRHLIKELSDETNVKMFERLLEIDFGDGGDKQSKTTESIYEDAFAKSDKTDAILVVQGKKLHVNKAILSYHSDYFDALFNSDFKEKSMTEIPIDDVIFEDFATLLSLIHLHPIMPTEENAEKVLELGERFLLPCVKHHLEESLISAPKDALEKIRIAEKYGLTKLLQHATLKFKDFGGLLSSDVYHAFSVSTKNKLFERYLDF